MPPVIKTLAQIKIDLDATGGNWIRIPDTYGLPVAQFSGGGVVNYISGQKGIVLVAFLNLGSAEVRFFLAKSVDVEERGKLF